MPHTSVRPERRSFAAWRAGKVVVGHDIKHDFRTLQYHNPTPDTRDTSKYPRLRMKSGIDPNHTNAQICQLKFLTTHLDSYFSLE